MTAEHFYYFEGSEKVNPPNKRKETLTERAGSALPLAVQARHSRSLAQLCHSELKSFLHAREYPECEPVAIQGKDMDKVFTERQC